MLAQTAECMHDDLDEERHAQVLLLGTCNKPHMRKQQVHALVLAADLDVWECVSLFNVGLDAASLSHHSPCLRSR